MFGHNKAFESDPFGYVQRYAVNHLAMKVYGEKDAYDFDDVQHYDERGRPVPGEYSRYNNEVNRAKGDIERAGEGCFDLEQVVLQGASVMYLRFVVPGRYAPAVEYGGVERGADPAFRAYWLGYLMPGLQGEGKGRIPFVDIPKVAPKHKLLLTGAMNGCSMVVTLHPTDATKLRVYHDSFHGKDTFKDDVVIARIDYSDQNFASANSRVLAPAAPVVRPRSGSTGAPASVSGPKIRERSGSLGGQPLAPAACIRASYGDMAQYRAVESGSGSGTVGTSVQVRTSFNFLYYDTGTAHWVAVSQPLETQPAVAQPVKGWFEGSAAFERRQKAHRRRGVQVATPPSSPPWQGPIPY